MATKAAVENTKNFIISSTEKGSQDKHSLLDLYKKFDIYLSEEKIQRPVVVLPGGHSQKLTTKFCIPFMIRNLICLLVFLIQLSDQSPNQTLHREYDKKRDELFTTFQTIN